MHLFGPEDAAWSAIVLARPSPFHRLGNAPPPLFGATITQSAPMQFHCPWAGSEDRRWGDVPSRRSYASRSCQRRTKLRRPYFSPADHAIHPDLWSARRERLSCIGPSLPSFVERTLSKLVTYSDRASQTFFREADDWQAAICELCNRVPAWIPALTIAGTGLQIP
jgi:hypothetical protein